MRGNSKNWHRFTSHNNSLKLASDLYQKLWLAQAETSTVSGKLNVSYLPG
jgi:hypothetical protein